MSRVKIRLRLEFHKSAFFKDLFFKSIVFELCEYEKSVYVSKLSKRVDFLFALFFYFRSLLRVVSHLSFMIRTAVP